MASGLVGKLRIKAGQRLLVLNAPEGYIDSLEALPEDVEISAEPGDKRFDFVQVFVKDKAEFWKLYKSAIDAAEHDVLLWICYPKSSSKLQTDLNRDSLWEMVEDAGTGLRPVSAVSIDDVWSALRFRPEEEVGT